MITDPALLMRAVVRDAAVALLVNALPQCAGRVFRARLWPLSAGQLPAALVYAVQEDKRNVATAGGALDFVAELTLRVHARAEGATAEALEDTLDQLAIGIQSALLVTPDWVNLFQHIPAARTEYAAQSGGDRPVGEVQFSLTLQWQELYAEDLRQALMQVALRINAGGQTVAGADLALNS